ncbi:hypothetical protein [Croceicoccus bisphenolivorans]|uniref:hypothetical protein n=1 Tax=Croceicoccus bisphenolivorans TaxID=1783232 RepID=UPI00082D3CF9|nr:hypothetical protein [Croceicoccus bisphenolivorans]
MSDRYSGKPFLKLLDAYVVDAIGHMDGATELELAAMEPQMRGALGLSGDWRSLVEQRMKFPAGMSGAIREVWDKGRLKFIAGNGREPDPLEFTIHFVDTNFPH